MATAADDEIVPRNPCRIRGADREESPERPVLTAVQVNALASLVPDRFQALALLATFAGLRWGEVTALRRRDLDLSARMVRVARVHVESAAGQLSVGPPKSRAGERTVAFPSALVPALTRHLDSYVGPEPGALVFTGPKGAILRRGNFRKLVRWAEATAGIGVPDLDFHDLRHTGATLAAQTGASLRDLMRRIGHDSTAAPLPARERRGRSPDRRCARPRAG